MANYIEIKNLKKTYNDITALDNLDLDLAKGRVYGIQ